MAYIGSRPDNVISRNAQNEYNYTATGGQTTFTGADSNNNTLSYTPGNIEVYFNGARLEESDFTATNGTSIVLANAAVVNDELSIVAVNVFEVADVVPASTGGTFQGGIAVQGGVNVAGHILPDTNITYDLGSTTQRFRDLYLSGNSIQLGTRTISQDNVPDVNLAIAPEVLTIDVAAPAAGQDTQWLWNWLTSSLPYARRAITNSNELNVPLYKQGTYTVNNFAKTQYGSMTQAHTMYFKWIEGAGTQNNISWVTDQGTFTDSHPDINGGADTTVQRLSISVPSTITPPTLTTPSVTYTVTNSGSGSYTFSGPRDGNNPNIGPLRRGGTYTFNINATGHPFYLTTDNGTNFSAGTYFGEYTSGVTGSRTDSGTLTFVVPANAPDTLYYQCGNHSSMRGAITVKDLVVETNINGNYVVYAQHTQEGHKTPVELRPIPSLVNQMCLVYDSSVNKFVPQDLATYVENTPSFENKIREVAGTAELVVEDGSAVVAKVNVYADSTYLPLTDNNAGDQAFATDTDKLYIWDGSAWQLAGAANTGELPEGTNLYYTDARVASYLSSNDFDTATNIVASITDSAPATLDTLNELAAALGDDANFSTTVTNSIATKLSLAGGTMTGNLNIDVADLFVKDTTGGAQGQVQIGAGTAQGFINIQKGDGTRTVQLNSDGTSYLTGGNVGIGNAGTNPGNPLHVNHNGAPSGIVAKYQSNGNPWVQQTGASSSWQTGTTSKGWELYNDNTNAYRIAVQTDGDVGIGTRDPTAKLEVANAAGGATVFINTTQTWTAANLSEFSNTPLVINSRASGAQLRFSGATDYVSIQSLTSDLSTAKNISLNPFGGNVGIGTDSPGRSLHVVSSTVGGLAAFEGTNNGIVIQGHSSNANIVEIVGYKQSDATYADVHIRANTDGLIVKEDTGNVGIGTTTPDTKLNVSTGTGVDSGIRIQNGASQRGNIFYDGVQALVIHGASAPGGGDASSNPTLHFATGGTTPVNRMSITRDGNVGIGITNPGTPLHIDNGNVDGTILRLTNEEVGLNVTVDGGTGNYSGSARTVTFNATRFDGGDEPALRLAGQDRIEFAADANNVKMTLDKNSGFNNSSQLNLHNTYLRRSTEKITEWTAFTHCTTPDNANFIHIRTPIITHTASSGNISAYQPVAIEIYGFHNYAAENFHDATVVVNTPSNGSFQVNTRANNNNHSSMTVYRSNNTYNGYNRVCISLPKSTCCCVGALWIRFRWWNGLPTDNYAWGHTGTYASTDGF